jgi:hypothetical protein
MADRERDEGRGEVIETEEATAGGAQELDTTTTRGRADDVGLLPPDELERRQRKLRTRRRWGGPSLRRTKVGRGDEAETTDDEPTETEEPPSD